MKVQYRVQMYSVPGDTLFYTRLRVDDIVLSQFYQFTESGWIRIHSASDEIWMEKGWHVVKVEYFSTKDIHNMPANTPGGYAYCVLTTEYLQY